MRQKREEARANLREEEKKGTEDKGKTVGSTKDHSICEFGHLQSASVQEHGRKLNDFMLWPIVPVTGSLEVHDDEIIEELLPVRDWTETGGKFLLQRIDGNCWTLCCQRLPNALWPSRVAARTFG